MLKLEKQDSPLLSHTVGYIWAPVNGMKNRTFCSNMSLFSD